MNEKKPTINYPNEVEMDKHINNIVDAGMPGKKSIIDHLLVMYSEVGLGHLFKDKTEILFLIFIGFSVMSFLSLSLTSNQAADHVYIFLFTISPCVYFILAVRSFVQKMYRDAQIEHTTKYSMTQLSAFRMFLFSIVSLGLNTIVIAFISIFITDISILRAFLIMSCSLLLFSVMFLFVFNRSSTSFIQSWGLASLWVVVNGLLYLIFPTGFQDLLTRIPLVAYILVSLIGMILLCKSIQSLFSYNIHKEVG
ncbi:hypothetical protein [Alkalicoccobacillus porphyridii]|uniref:Uncharacterized protein n=1 Tax=Alkalicoccobacillus porphyridii TaxID=2597270 RepID=A0A553ZYV9_9BACI|nr:hypothetical protein [Alkalicoccobacillus porphyridii]TSB46631.1 hypothetical protein FN960_09755 [Alkalicoccobacillus porphyridii]